MDVSIRYYTRTGNTKKLAQAISESIGVSCDTIDVPLDKKVDILFLGTSYYAFDIDVHVKAFLTENKDRIGKVVAFGTSAMMKSIYKPLKRFCKGQGIELYEKDFHCRGEFKFANKGRPDNNDLLKASDFAKALIAKF